MHPRLRLWLVGALGAALGLTVATGIAQESYFVTRVLALAILWIVAEWINGARPEAWLLAGVLLGYIVGNRGFAQFNLSSDLPLLPAEAVLLVTLPALGARLALRQGRAFFRDGLNYALLAWMVLGAARLPVDLARHGFFAARDFAMVYYAAFFFLGQACAGHALSVRLLQRTLTVAFVVLPAVALVEQQAPDFFSSHFTVHGVPVIFHKNDLLAAYLAAGFLWLWTRWEKHRHWAWLVAAAASLLMLGTTASSRAALAALAGVTVMWLIARRWRIAAAQLVMVGTAVCVVLFAAALSNRSLRQTPVYATYEHAVSIFDLTGTGTYTNQESGDPGDNNRFRLTWWRAVITDTAAQNPLFGLGFGYDLAARFLVDYDLLLAEDFNTRSPHSMLVSVLGRMGAVGLALWLAVAAGMARLTARCFQQVNLDALGLVNIAWVLWISACFGVVLEVPMGAVVFWTVLGLANQSLGEMRLEDPVPVADLHPAAPADEVPATL